MPYTSHGHWYGPGDPTRPEPTRMAKCGGPLGGLCAVCKREAMARLDYTIKVVNVTAAEAETVVRLLHSTGYPTEVIDTHEHERRVPASPDSSEKG